MNTLLCEAFIWTTCSIPQSKVWWTDCLIIGLFMIVALKCTTVNLNLLSHTTFGLHIETCDSTQCEFYGYFYNDRPMDGWATLINLQVQAKPNVASKCFCTFLPLSPLWIHPIVFTEIVRYFQIKNLKKS